MVKYTWVLQKDANWIKKLINEEEPESEEEPKSEEQLKSAPGSKSAFESDIDSWCMDTVLQQMKFDTLQRMSHQASQHV